MTTALSLGEREYEFVPFLEAGETPVDEINFGEDDGQYILAHQAEIPIHLREKIKLIFLAWRHPGDPRYVAYSCWDGRQWVQRWDLLDGRWLGLGLHWNDNARLVRRRK